ncbi:MAG: hypothetical protein QM703_25595 [Gemmatales bacterium]
MKLEDHAALTVALIPLYLIASHFENINNVALTILLIVGGLFLGRLLHGVIVICLDPRKYPEEVKVIQNKTPDSLPDDTEPSE